MLTYLIAEVNLKEPEAYSEYLSKVPKIISKYKGEYLVKGEYDQALDYYDRALENIEELGDEYRLEMITNSFLVNKYLGKEYDIQEIYKLIEKTDEIDYMTNFSLYKLLDDKLYLEKAYDQIQDKGNAMEENVRKKFFNFPIPKRIIEKYNSAGA